MRSHTPARLPATAPSMRCVVLQAAVTATRGPRRHFLSTVSPTSPIPPQRHRQENNQQQQLLRGRSPQPAPGPPPPPLPPLSFLPSPSNRPGAPTADAAPDPDRASLARATSLFTAPPACFLYSAPRFLHVPVNTRVPEVCLLGRSNVGKSTLVNALAGVSSAAAGRSHRAVARKAAAERSRSNSSNNSSTNRSSATNKGGIIGAGGYGPAVTSSTAGCTRTINAYGFGPPARISLSSPPTPSLATLSEEVDSVDDEGNDDGSMRGPSRRTGLTSRTERRRQSKKAGEAMPRHSLVLMDMPGYGLNSRAEWGVEIAKYLARRAALRGAVLLVDAVAGLKDGDRIALGLLRDAGVRTAVVLTKADKLGYGADGSQAAAGQRAVEDMCLRIWEELREVEGSNAAWTEGTGWERRIWVTGAGDPKNAGVGVAGARLAICKMAGLVADDDSVDGALPVPEAGSSGSKVVPFDQLQWA